MSSHRSRRCNRRRTLALAAVVALASACHRDPTPAAKAGLIAILGPFVLEPIRPDVTSAYMTFRNDGDSADALVDATTAVAGTAMLHGRAGGGRAWRRFPLSAAGTPHHGPRSGENHLMLSDVRTRLAPGDTVPITLRFQRAGRVTVPFVVRTYESIGH